MSNELDPVRIGSFIAGKRRMLGFTQQSLAEQLNVTNKAVSKWETGQGAPDIGTLPRLAAVLQVTVDEILRGENALPASNGNDQAENEREQAVLTVQLSLSRHFLLLAAKVYWQGLYTGLRLLYLFAGIVLLALAFAGIGVSQLTAHSISPVVPAICTLSGIVFLALSVEGYRLLRLIRNHSADETCTIQFMEDHFSMSRAGAIKSWRYEHVTQLLESNDGFVILCGRDREFIQKQSLPAEQWEKLHFFLRAHCRSALYRNLSRGRAGRVCGLGCAGAALLILLFQLAYLFVHVKYGVIYQVSLIAYLINFIGLVLSFLSSVFLARKQPAVWVFSGVLCGTLMIADMTGSLIASAKTQDILSVSPSGQNILVLKRDVSTDKVEQYRRPFLFFARPYQQFPYTAYGKIKTQWLTGDICAVTYVSEPGGPAHQTVATFGNRGRNDSYYVEAALTGSWEPSGQNTAGWRLVRDTKGIVLSNGTTEYDYSAKDCVQYGLTTLVLCRNGLPQWTVVLNEDCKIDPKTLLVSYGGTLTLCQVSMNPTAPLVLRSTSKSSVSGNNVLIESSAKDAYRIRDGVLSFSWDYGHRWTTVSLPKNALDSILESNSTTKLMPGCYHVADDFSYLLYGQAPLSVLFTLNQGKTWETHPVANLADDGITSRFVVYTSGQTADIAVGLDGTADMKGSLLYTTKDGGLTWQNEKTPSTQPLTGMNFLNQDIGYLSYSESGGASGKLYETTDGGQTFTQATLPAGNLAEIGGAASGLSFGQVYDTPQVPHLENGLPVLYVTQGSDGDFGNYRARYESKDGGRTWHYVSQEKPAADSGS